MRHRQKHWHLPKDRTWLRYGAVSVGSDEPCCKQRVRGTVPSSGLESAHENTCADVAVTRRGNGQSEKLSPQVAAPPPGLLVESPRPSKVRLGSCQRQRRDPARGMHSGWRPTMLKPEAAASTPGRCHPPPRRLPLAVESPGPPSRAFPGIPGHHARTAGSAAYRGGDSEPGPRPASGRPVGPPPGARPPTAPECQASHTTAAQSQVTGRPGWFLGRGKTAMVEAR